jgi:glycosyltransferase involved in cell wall biosynthesis
MAGGMGHGVDAVEPLYVEVSTLLAPRLTGIGRFVARLVEALARQRPLRLVNTIEDRLAREMDLSAALPAGLEVAVTPAELPPADGDVGRWARRLLGRPRWRHNAELARRCSGLFTVWRPAARHFRHESCIFYDFTPLLLPWAHAKETLASFGQFFGKTAGLCDKAVAISQSTRADAAWLAAIPEQDVVVGYPGPSLCVRRHASEVPAARRENVILVVSTLEPRKNGRFLLNWFLNTRVVPPGTELWWAGPPGWLSRVETRSPRRGPGNRRVRFLGMVPDGRLCELYRQAALTIYPSLYEGFGFPVLDSLRHGTPVLCSCNSSLQEFAGPGVFYFDPADPATLDEAYQELRQAGPAAVDRPELASRFSWDRLAETVLELCA